MARQQLAKLKYLRRRAGHLDAVVGEDTGSRPGPRLLLIELAANEGDGVDDAGGQREGCLRDDFRARRIRLFA
ncbi:hypothetical protein RHECNPAF_2330079 [Rhizobium etli CNPAF512]|nr:hypothetical protein RHECNPAF_2330079 [Rhizobium etli CNPAF512]